MPDAVVIGSGPNGLVAANVLADHGWDVVVLEANAEPGGAVRTAEVTAPGFRNDLFSAFYPLGAKSPVLGNAGAGGVGPRVGARAARRSRTRRCTGRARCSRPTSTRPRPRSTGSRPATATRGVRCTRCGSAPATSWSPRCCRRSRRCAPRVRLAGAGAPRIPQLLTLGLAVAAARGDRAVRRARAAGC